ncbi:MULTISPECIES: peptidoglycan DD-metalloendopeptidase family protein [unclassified Meiothermus]|uniref:peptidoglycan DD-metalloendopeptidase family protein n=1 Tax=unclassified Meiothermus TaxID=370471 RepID=UPI001F241AFD|nr:MULTISPECIES: peptidoglycan DD-metalloendopeptidase family protein [unclassified Meiothermus]
MLNLPLATLDIPKELAPSNEVVLDAPAKKGWVLYTVKSGDTLSAIASRYAVDPRAILWSTGISSPDLKPGQLLRIPITAQVEHEARIPPGVREYVVQSGDTLQTLARRFGVTELDLVSANPSLSSLDRLAEGSVIYIPTQTKGLLIEMGKGQTLADLAERFGVPLLSIAKANGVKNPLELRAGDLVLLPGIQARTTYDRLLAVREEERRQREEEQRRLAEERRRQEEARRLAEQQRQRQLAQARLQRQQQAAVAHRSQAGQSPTVRRVDYEAATSGFQWPLGNFVITTYYGQRGAFQRFHTGIDLAAPMGTPIYAAKAGQVETAGWSSWGYGLHVIIDHGSGVETLYGHMSRIAVQPGQFVERGQLIGYVGSTGWSTGPHCHFEVRVGGATRNPLAYLP